jgi:hypothetical protein
MTGVVDGKYYPNPKEYLKRIKEKAIDATSEFEIIRTMLGIAHETRQALMVVLGGGEEENVEERERFEKVI